MNNRPPVIVMVGGGSYGWSPLLMNDILNVPGLEKAEIRICDTDLQAADLMTRLFRKMAQQAGRSLTFHVADNQRQAFRGADFVLVTIFTGGLECFATWRSFPRGRSCWRNSRALTNGAGRGPARGRCNGRSR